MLKDNILSHPANDRIIDNKRDNLDLSPYPALDYYNTMAELEARREEPKSNPELHKQALEGLKMMFKKYDDA